MADYGFTGNNVTIAQAIIECANRIIQMALQTGLNPQMANALMGRIQNEVNGLAQYVHSNFVNKDGMFDDNVLVNWLKDVLNRWTDEMFPMNNGYNNYGAYYQPPQQYGSPYGQNYGGYNNYGSGYGYSTRPQFGSQINQNFIQAAQYQQPYQGQNTYNQYGNGIRFDPRNINSPMMNNSGANTSMMGIGSALGKQNVNNQSQPMVQQNQNTGYIQMPVVENTQPINQVIETTNSEIAPVTMTTPLSSPNDSFVTDLRNSVRNTLNNRKNKLRNIDKITSNDTEIAMGDFVLNKVFSEETAIIDNRSCAGITSKIREMETPDTIESIEYAYSAKITEEIEDDTSVDAVELSIPMNSATEALEYVKNNIPNISTSTAGNKKSYVVISYDELTARKLPGEGKLNSEIFNAIVDKVAAMPHGNPYDGVVEYFSEEIMPVIRKATEAGRAYIEKLIFNKFNDLFDRFCTVPYNHSFRPNYMTKHNNISEIIDPKDNEFTEYMFKYFPDTYPDAVKSCLYKTLKAIFGNETIDIDSPVSKGILAHSSELSSVNYGRYRLSDYGVMPEDSLKNLLNKVKKDYLVHTTRKTVMFTNVDINAELPDAEYIYISNCAKVHEAVLSTAMDLCTSTSDITILTLDKYTRVTSSMKISSLVDDTILIKRI